MKMVVPGSVAECAASLATRAAAGCSVVMVEVVMMVDIDLMALAKRNVLVVGREWVRELAEAAAVPACLMVVAAYVEGALPTLGLLSTPTKMGVTGKQDDFAASLSVSATWGCSVVMADVVAMGAMVAERVIVFMEAGGVALIWDEHQSKKLPAKNNVWA